MVQVNSQGQVEIYKHGITRSFLDNGRIVVVKTEGDMSRGGIDTWATLLILTMQEWKSDRPLALLHDLRHPAQGLTPYSRQRTIDVLRACPKGLRIYSAVLLPETFIKRIIEMFLRTPVFKRSRQRIRVFSCEEKALAWLREKTH